MPSSSPAPLQSLRLFMLKSENIKPIKIAGVDTNLSAISNVNKPEASYVVQLIADVAHLVNVQPTTKGLNCVEKMLRTLCATRNKKMRSWRKN